MDPVRLSDTEMSSTTSSSGMLLEYQKLDASRREIRLLHASSSYSGPASMNKPLVSRLVVVSLSDKPAYDALSYMWGPPEPSFEIFVDGQVLRVRANLRQALLSLREGNKAESIWVDGICINQDDAEERAQQVQLMADIYSNAQTVRVWIP